MNLAILAAELQLPQYAGLSDAEIAAALNTVGPPSRQRVTIERLQAVSMESGIYTALRVAVGSAETPPQLRALCQTVLDLANARFADVDLDNPASQQMFGTLRQAGVITAQQAALIDALATVPGHSRADELGLGVVVEVDVQVAREWHGYDNLEQRLTAGSAIALGWLRQQRDAGEVAPEWAAVLERM